MVAFILIEWKLRPAPRHCGWENIDVSAIWLAEIWALNLLFGDVCSPICTCTCQQPLKTPQKVSFQVVLLLNESILFLVPKIKKINTYRCNFSKIKMRQVWCFQTWCWMSEKSLFNFGRFELFPRPEDWLLCYCFYMSTYWLMIGQDFALSAKNHESALSLLLLSSHGCWKQSQLCQVFNLAWVNAKLISHEEEFEISLLCSKETSRQMGFKGMLLWSWGFFTHHLFPCQNRT